MITRTVAKAAIGSVAISVVAGCGGGGGGALSQSRTPTERSKSVALDALYESGAVIYQAADPAPAAAAFAPISYFPGYSSPVGLEPTDVRTYLRLVTTDTNDPAASSIPRTGVYFSTTLGAWVDQSNGSQTMTENLYAFQTKEFPEGRIVTAMPVNSNYPRSFNSTYSLNPQSFYKASGSIVNDLNADGSTTATYSGIRTTTGGAFGLSDSQVTYSGSSALSAAGDYSWSGTEQGDGSANDTFRGIIHRDGSWEIHSKVQTELVIDYTNKVDGTGTGQINSSAPGFPAKISYNTAFGTTITFADGSYDTISGYSVGVGDIESAELNGKLVYHPLVPVPATPEPTPPPAPAG